MGGDLDGHYRQVIISRGNVMCCVQVRDLSVSTIGGGRGYDDSVPGEVTKTTPSGDRTT